MHILQINEFILFDKKFTKFINSFVTHKKNKKINRYKIYKYCFFMHTNAMSITQKIYQYCYFMHTNAMNLIQIDDFAII